MHMGKSLSEQTASKPYQGVRVKDPVKELLRRKRGTTARTVPPTAVVVPNNSLPSYAHAGSSCFPGTNQSILNESTVDIGALSSGWVSQSSSSAAFQPLGHWAPPEYLHHDPTATIPTLPSLTTDMYVQPVCPSYTVVGPSSMLTLTHTPLFTNLGTISPSSSALPQVEVPDSSLAYIPWAQPLSTLTGPVMQRPPCPQTVNAPQLLPLPVPLPPVPAPIPQSEPQQVEPTSASEGTLALEKLLEDEEEDKESYACSPSLFTQDI
ncbi:POU domain class 2-associating factor 1 [Astyanax mexicanus]|uniref:POU domain class 2-associating factor 1 n=1 Tax=Astyanax mexicanus TaxID=7994 RepID=UPI0020CAB782|nr:POU domain class 2-associating factor 1 [Astyanax mexicanus]